MSELNLAEAMALLADLTKQVNELKTSAIVVGPARNHKDSTPAAGRKYVRLLESLPTWGKVPQQQADIADILTKGMELNKEYTEAEVFAMINENFIGYNKLASSVQSATYLFRYYRGLKNDGTKYGGYIGRGFLRQIN